MHILILGATGFIGNHIFHSLATKHKVSIAGRQAIGSYPHWHFLDFTKEEDWNSILDGVDLVINCIGSIEGNLTQIQRTGPIHFYKLCTQKKIRILHISAIGADSTNPKTEFLQTKKETDDFLLNYENAKILYPAIVIGKEGKSTQFFTELASLPIAFLPKNLNPPTIHIRQLTSLVSDVVENFANYPKQIFAVAKEESFLELLKKINPRKRITVNIPLFLPNLVFTIFPKLKIGIFSKDMFTLLEDLPTEKYYNHPANFTNLSFKDPIQEKKTTDLIDPKELIQSQSIPYFLGLISVSFIWIWSAISSLISWDLSNQIMKEIIPNDLISAFSIYLGCFIDIVLGITMFYEKLRSPVLKLQILIIATYTIILSIFAPHYWLHTLGVIGKNIPLLALIYYLLQKENETK